MRGRVLAVACVAILTACDGGSAVQRGFGSQQLVSIRDERLDPGQWFGSTWVYSTSGGYSSLDLDTGAVVYLGTEPPQPKFPPPPDNRYKCEFGLSADGQASTITITDSQSGQSTVIDRVEMVLSCPSEIDGRIKVWRRGDDGKLALWTGRYDQLMLAPSDLDVHSVYPFLSRAGTNDLGFYVFAASPAQPDGLGIFLVDPVDAAISQIVPATLGSVAWAAGAAAQQPVLASTSVGQRWLIPQLGGHLLYTRLMSDGSTAMFLGPLSGEPSELELFPIGDSEMLEGLRSWSVGPSPLIWQAGSPAEGNQNLIMWSDQAQQLTRCSSPFGQSQILPIPSRDGEQVTLMNLTDSFADVPIGPGPLMLMGGGRCTTLATKDVSDVAFSPEGALIAWRVQPPQGDATLWVAASDGSGARAIGTGEISGHPVAPRFIGPRVLELELTHDLVWIDVDDGLGRLHYIAERVFGEAVDVGEKLITGYGFSVQDATGTLGLVDRQTGDKKPISPEVGAFTAVGPRPTDDLSLPVSGITDSDPIRILYTVRGRNPSAQDGIWIATIDPAAGN